LSCFRVSTLHVQATEHHQSSYKTMHTGI
jgi:hypothetical protein